MIVCENEKLLDSKDVMWTLGLSYTAISGRLCSGNFPEPDMKIGNKNYWKPSTISAYKKTSNHVFYRTLRVKLLQPNAKPPKYTREADACLDLYSDGKKYYIQKGEVATIGTGIAVEIPKGYMGIIAPRSGFTKQGVLSQTGIIEYEYRGEIKITVYNATDHIFEIQPYTRLAQIYFQPMQKMQVLVVPELSKTDRGEAGFGSSGVK